MDGFERIGERSCMQTYETDRHAIDLLALIYQALIDQSSPVNGPIDSEQRPQRTPLSGLTLQEAKS